MINELEAERPMSVGFENLHGMINLTNCSPVLTSLAQASPALIFYVPVSPVPAPPPQVCMRERYKNTPQEQFLNWQGSCI